MADLTITAASVLQGTSEVGHGTAGETITAGQSLYTKAADGRLWKAQCDTTDAEATGVVIALNGGGAGQTISYTRNGPMNIGATTAKTTTYCLSATAGGICPQADLVSTNRIVRVGHATATDGSLFVDVRNIGAVV